MKQIFLLTCLFILTTSALRAQFTVKAEYRNRFDLCDGYRQLVAKGTQPSFLIWQRTRLSFGYQTEIFELKITPQDARIWGDETLRTSTGVFGDNASIELFEGYAALRLKTFGWLQVGRQQLKYDNQRLFASRNWNNFGMAYDAALLKLNATDWNFHLGATWNSIGEAYFDNLYPRNRIKNINFLWVNRKFDEGTALSMTHLTTGVTETDTTNALHYKHTTGAYFTYNKDRLSSWIEAYYQYGETNQSKPVSAFLVAADASIKTGKLTQGLGFVYLSGNSQTGSDLKTEQLFDIHYGGRHRFYGGMDYFRDFTKHTNQAGLVDYYFYLNYQIGKKYKLINTGHFFQLANTNADTPDNRNLGYENDLIFSYNFNEWGVFEAGYLFYIPTKSLETIQKVENAGYQQYAYLQLTLTPSLFKQ